MFLLQEETNSFLKAIEEANKKMEAAEISLEEKDQRIGELDRLIERMEKVMDTALGPAPAFPESPPSLFLQPPAGLSEGVRSPQHSPLPSLQFVVETGKTA